MRKRNWIWMIGLLVSLAVIVSACATPAAEEPAQEELIVEESVEMEGDDDVDMDDSSDDDVVVDEGDEQTEAGSGESENQSAPSVELPSEEEMLALLEEKVAPGIPLPVC